VFDEIHPFLGIRTLPPKFDSLDRTSGRHLAEAGTIDEFGIGQRPHARSQTKIDLVAVD
jgi:hypothetical protein